MGHERATASTAASRHNLGAATSLSGPSSKSHLVIKRRRPGSSAGLQARYDQEQGEQADTQRTFGDIQNSSTGVVTKRNSSGPAKLLKRRSTTRSLSNQLWPTSASSATVQDKEAERPATTVPYGTSLAQDTDMQALPNPAQSSLIDDQIKPYIRTLAESSGAYSNTGKKNEENQNGIRHILPRRTCTPMLMKPEELAPKPRRRLLKTRAEKRRSILSFDFSSYFSSSTPEPAQPVPDITRPKSRRSFSISDMLASVSLIRKPSDEPKIPRRRLQRPTEHRTASTPVLATRHDNASVTNGLLAFEGRSEHTRSMSALVSYTRNTSQSEELIGIVTGTSYTSTNSEHPSLAQAVAYPLANSSSPIAAPVAVEANDAIIRPSYHSTATSDFTSSQIGSDADNRVFSSCDEDEADFRSDTAYDSIRTGMTRGSGVFPGSLFDKDEGGRSRATSLQDISGTGSPTTMRAHDDVIFEEDENALTPRHIPTSTQHDIDMQHRLSYQTAVQRSDSSSPGTKQPLSLGKLDWDNDIEDEWSDYDARGASNGTAVQFRTLADWSEEPSEDVQEDMDTLFERDGGSLLPHPYNHRKPRQHDVNGDSKSSLFDWSEHPVLDRNQSDLPPRPKTVHGNKKNSNGRNSRPDSRRAPSGPHARSQSVPAVMNDQLEPRVGATSKFGTWGVGMRGATEDWDDDFDFDIPKALPTISAAKTEARTDSGVAIVVPQAIREQQSNVLANIGLLKEWGVLIEELKELRLRATRMGLDDVQAQAVFDEVDAMIDLADQEVDEPQFPSDQAASAQWPDESESDSRRESATPSIASPTSEDDVFGPLPPSLPSTALPSPNRPRKNSQAIARSVIEAVQQRRDRKLSVPAPTSTKNNSKVPFDKGTLRHILPHLQGLVKSMKTILRDADSFGISPERRPPPSFSQAFIAPSDSPSRRCTSPNDGHSPIRDGLPQILSS